jgi:hypothetical protein
MGELHIAPLPNSNSTYFVYKQTDETNAKECPVCYNNCTSYIHCDISEKHFVCKDCSKKMLEVKYKDMFENTAFVNPDSSIDKWECPICRHQNELEVVKIARAPNDDDFRDDFRARTRQLSTGIAQVSALIDLRLRERQQEQALAREQETNEVYRQVIEDPLSRIDETSPSKFRWVLSLNWSKNISSHFKAWIMYNSPTYVENINNRPPSGAELTALKEQHYYEERKRSPEAPWYKFLDRTTPP